ncbi:MAG: histone deacetylase [candidate division Zixibacteria bacterium]|nr:histone deacetylase [candidate division Zixibacteria bacterium]
MGSDTTPTGTGWVYHDDFLRHNAAIDHPERPDRLRAIHQGLIDNGLLQELQQVSIEPLDDSEIMRVHTREYLATVDSSENRYLDPDTYVGEGSPSIARLAAGGVVAAARAVWNGSLRNAFGTIRPPGHHALWDRAMGFCLFNNIAIAACAIQADDRRAKVMILDWDVHHGNGTQAIFYEDSAVLYTSLHQYPFYPGTGAATEVGRAMGNGYTANVPLPAGSGDTEFLAAMETLLNDHGVTFAPDILLISCGFDAHRLDPLAGLEVSTDAFGEATRMAVRFADEICQGRLVSVLEGGYSTQVLAEAGAVHVRELLNASMGKTE